jgi:hypothetical protein
VLRSRPLGTVCIGLNIGGGTGAFASRIREHNVTVVTTTLDQDAPFNQCVVSQDVVASSLAPFRALRAPPEERHGDLASPE